MNGKYPSLLKLLHKLIMMRYITEKSDTHKSSIKKPDRKKRYFLQFILLLGLIASLGLSSIGASFYIVGGRY